MKVGLLMCDHVSPEYRERFGDYSDKFERLFPELDFAIYDVVNNEFPDRVDECEVYMATGSRFSVYNKLKWIERLKLFIKQIHDRDSYYVGLCFGHQLIGESLGGKVEKAPGGWCVGVHEFELKEDEEWIKPTQEKFNLLMMCQDQILELPEEAKTLAGSPNCPNGMIRIRDKILGVQAHPEFSKEYNQLLMETRMNKMGDDVATEGIATLAKDIHNDLIRTWILEFLSM